MNEVVQAINNLTQKTLMDYLSIITPLVLSVVAIGISITTARKQNKIALFEKRFEIYNLLQEVIVFNKIIKTQNYTPFDNLDNWVTFKKINYKIKKSINFHAETILDEQNPELKLIMTDPDNVIHDVIVLKYCLKNEILNLNQSTYAFPKRLRFSFNNIIKSYEAFIDGLINEYGCNANEQHKITKMKNNFILCVDNFKNDSRLQRQLNNCLTM